MINLIIGIISAICFIGIGLVRAGFVRRFLHKNDDMFLINSYRYTMYDTSSKVMCGTTVTQWQYHGIIASAHVKEGGNCCVEMAYTNDGRNTKCYYKSQRSNIWADTDGYLILDPHMRGVLDHIWQMHINASNTK